METGENPEDVDMKYLAGVWLTFIGSGFILLAIITLYNGSTVYLVGYIIPVVMIVLGIYLMKTSRTETITLGAPIYVITSIFRGRR